MIEVDISHYLTLPLKCDAISYYINIKRSIAYVSSHYIAKIKIDSYDFLSIEITFNLPNVKVHIKSVLNKDKTHY